MYTSYVIGPGDYTTVNSQISFEPQSEGQSTTECMDVPISDDITLEAIEMFTVELQSSNSVVSIDSSANSAMIVIMDDDSM